MLQLAATSQTLNEGASALVSVCITDEEMSRFAQLSGDYNPLHTDADFARGKGFEDKVVYGALLLAKVSQLIGMKLPGRDAVWAAASFEFRKPLYVGQRAELSGRVLTLSPSTGLVELRLELRRAGELLGKGRAEVLIAA